MCIASSFMYYVIYSLQGHDYTLTIHGLGSARGSGLDS